MLLFVLGPLLVFAPRLAAAKRNGLREYGMLAKRYTDEFDHKWLRSGVPPDEPLIGSADIQSLADLGTSFEVIKDMWELLGAIVEGYEVYSIPSGTARRRGSSLCRPAG